MASSRADFDGKLLESYTDEELTYYIEESPTLTTTRAEIIRVLSEHLVAKPVSWEEEYRDEKGAFNGYQRTRGSSCSTPPQTQTYFLFHHYGTHPR